MALMGVLLYYVGIRPFAGKPGLSWVVSTIGFGIVLQSIGLAMWGPNTVIVPSPVGDHLLSFFGARIRLQEVLVLVAALVVMFIMDWAMRRTILGKIMRAVAHSKSNATLMGINVSAVMIGAFAVSSALAALSGLLIAPIATASIYMGLGFGLKGFSAAIVGGLTNPRGCVIGGFAIGAIESLVNLWQAQFRDIVVFAIVILVLALRPNGLFGAQGTDKS
jgi:branched-chain amino acid transport system permease protein